MKFLNSLKDKPLEEGLAMGKRHRWPWKKRGRNGGRGVRREFVVSFMGTNLRVDTSVLLKVPPEKYGQPSLQVNKSSDLSQTDDK